MPLKFFIPASQTCYG